MINFFTDKQDKVVVLANNNYVQKFFPVFHYICVPPVTYLVFKRLESHIFPYLQKNRFLEERVIKLGI